MSLHAFADWDELSHHGSAHGHCGTRVVRSPILIRRARRIAGSAGYRIRGRWQRGPQWGGEEDSLPRSLVPQYVSGRVWVEDGPSKAFAGLIELSLRDDPTLQQAYRRLST